MDPLSRIRSPPEFLAAVARAGRMRPPPPMFPTEPRPEHPTVDPGYIPVPPGIRAVYTTQALLLRSQPEMNHPVRRIPPIHRPGNLVPVELPTADVMSKWAILLGGRPEINPHA